mgnify:CR=1 FL=1
MGRPMHRVPDGVEIVEPPVGGGFVANATPDTFLGIQRGLVARQIVQSQSRVRMEELPDRVSLMPRGAIHVEPNPVAPESAIERLEDRQEPLPIPSRGAHQAIPPQQRRHPTGEIEPLVMLAGRGNPKALAPEGPPPPQPRMTSKTRLILEDDGFVGSQGVQFFLTSAGSVGRRPDALAGTHGWPASDRIRTGASTSAPAGPSAQSRSAASDGRPAWARPIAPEGAQKLVAIAPAAEPVGLVGRESAGPVDQDGTWASTNPSPRRSSRASTGSSSSGSAPARPRSNWGAGLPGPTGGQQSSGRSVPRGSPWRWPLSAPEWPRGAATLTSVVSCSQGIMGCSACHFI